MLGCDAACGGGADREQWRLLRSLPVFSHSLRSPQSNWAPLVLIPEWVGLCTFWDPVGLSNELSCEAGIFSCCSSTPTGVFNQWFEALFPCAGALGCTVCHLVHQLLPHRTAAALPTPLHNPPPLWASILAVSLPESYFPSQGLNFL